MPSSVREILDRRRVPLLGIAIGASLLGAWHNRFVQDDAFISFRYARHLVDGHGLVFNVGERVEGYTNFLWTLLVAGGLRLGIDPVPFTIGAGLIACAATLALTAVAAGNLCGRGSPVPLAAVLLLGANYSFSAYATGGLETQLQTALFAGAAALLFRFLDDPRAGPAAGLSIVLAMALLTRPDSALVAAVFGITALITVARRPTGRGAVLAALVVPGALIVGPWLLFKLSYYGSVLPNTFRAKVSSATSLTWGLSYVGAFAVRYWLPPALLAAALALPRLLRIAPLKAAALVATLALWLLYVVRVGGDFMEFRMLVPVLPFLFVLLPWSCTVFARGRAAAAALVLLTVAGSAAHAWRGGTHVDVFGRQQFIESVPALAAHLVQPGENWSGVGRALGRRFPATTGVTLSATACGAIPFYSDLPTIDMFGLNDAWVAREGVAIGFRPGHQRYAPVEYLLRRRVNLLIGHPTVRPAAAPIVNPARDVDWNRFLLVDRIDALPPGASLVEIPVDERSTLVALYLVRHAAVDAAIAAEGWRVHSLAGLAERGRR